MVRAERFGEVEVFSFDVDGTLVGPGFADSVWLRGIPAAYAAKEGLSFEAAFERIKREYDQIGENRIEWYKIDYWLKKFGLKLSSTKLFHEYESEIRIYEEAEGVLNLLKEEGYELVVSSNAAREFIEFQIQPLKHFFSRIFSATSDFGEVKKSDDFYARVCEILGVKPQAVVHTGDHWVFDFLNPRKIGIQAYYLDRTRAKNLADEDCKNGEGKSERTEDEFVICDLNELVDSPVC
ncbi:MAG: HAD family hydrolase [Methanophagales archaeon ANME-1-THS]|nr:MAG: HAD family hydrolase [Methanophagales archaeon ANME-1-THS]